MQLQHRVHGMTTGRMACIGHVSTAASKIPLQYPKGMIRAVQSSPPGSVWPDQEVLPNFCTKLLDLPNFGPKSMLLAVLAL